MKKRILFLTAAAVLAGCALTRDERSSSDVQIRESRTLSALFQLEQAVAAYYKAKGKIPPTLDALIPQYLASMPAVEISAPGGHRDTSRVEIYPSKALRGGQVDGSQIKDTGRWGYVFNDRQVVVFIDCTHLSSRGKPWYRERGAF